MSKVIRIAELPMKLEIAAYNNAIRPTVSQEPWQLQAKLTFVFSEKRCDVSVGVNLDRIQHSLSSWL